MANDLLVRVDATTAQFDRAMSQAQKATLRYEYQLGKAKVAQAEFDAAVAKSGASSTEARLAQEKLGASLARTTELEIRAGIAAKEAGEIQARSSAQAAAAAEAAAAKQAAASAKASAAAEAAAAKQAAATKKLGTIYGGIGLVAAGGLALAAKAASDFNAKMAQVQSLTRGSADQIAALSAATKGYASIGVSASEAADAEIELVKAGVSVKDILGGALTGTLNAAAAGQIDVAQATEIASAAMVQFGLSGKEIPHVADLLAAGADKSLGGINDLGEGLKAVGTTAHQFGLNIDETVGALSQFAAAGLTGSLGGTALKQALLKLEAPSAKASSLMQQYGISLYDAQGHTVTLANLAGQLQRSLGGVSAETRNAALATLFGSRAVQVANVLYKDGAKVTQDWVNKVNDSGFAAEQASGKMDSLSGDMEKLKATVTNTAIDFGQQLQPALRLVTQSLTDFFGIVGEVPGPVKAVAASMVAFTAAVGLGTFAVSRAKGALLSFRTTLGLVAVAEGEAGAAAALSAARMQAFRVGAGLVGVGLLTLGSQLKDTHAALAGLADTAGGAALGFAVAGPWGAAIGGAIGLTKGLASANDGLEQAMSNVDGALNSQTVSLTAAKNALADLKAKSAAYQADLGGHGVSFWSVDPHDVGDQFDAAFTHVSDFFTGTSHESQVATDEATTNLNNLRGALQAVAAEAGGSKDDFGAISTAIQKMGYSAKQFADLFANRNRSAPDSIAWETAAHKIADYNAATDSAAGRTKAVVDAVGALDDPLKNAAASATDLTDALTALLGPELSQSAANDAWVSSLHSLAADLSKNSKALTGNSNAALQNRDAVRSRVTAMTDALTADAKAGASSAELAAKLKNQRGALLDAAEAAGVSRRAMGDYINQLNLTPALVKTLIRLYGADDAISQLQSVAAWVRAIPSYKDVHVNVIAQGAGGHVVTGYAAGGPVYGGIPGRDSVPSMLMPGEHVLTKREVDNGGGHAAIMELRRALASPRGFATGGPVGGFSSAPRVNVSLPSGPMRMVLDVGNGQTFTGYVEHVADSKVQANAGFNAYRSRA